MTIKVTSKSYQGIDGLSDEELLGELFSNPRERIAFLNDEARQDLSNYHLTEGVRANDKEDLMLLLDEVKNFNDFTEDNDPYGEHDFGSIQFKGEKYFFKIDYYDEELINGSSNPADPSITRRVITVMLAEEY